MCLKSNSFTSKFSRAIDTAAISSALIFMLVLMQGCTPEYVIIKKTEYVHIGITKALLEPQPRTQLPDPNDFITATPEQSVTILTDLVAGLMGDIKKRDDRIAGISTLDDQNLAVVKDLNAKEESRVSKLTGIKVKELKGDERQ